MKKIIFIIILIIPFNIKALEINSNNAILYNLNNDTVLYEKNSEQQTKIASLTKIMTTIIAIENIQDLKQTVLITDKMFDNLSIASVAGFKVGDQVTYEDLLYGAMLPSGADATNALAILISSTEENFVKLMNEKAEILNMNNTNYENASGLDTSNNYSTVKDQATLLKYALTNSTFKEIYETKYYTTTTNLKLESTIIYYSEKYNIDVSEFHGSKTGYTQLAGLCMSSISSYNDINYLLITTNADSTQNSPLNVFDTKTIYEYYYQNYSYETLLEENQILTTLYKGNKEYVVYNEEEFKQYILSTNDYEEQYIGITYLTNEKKGEIIGEYIITYDGEIIKTIEIKNPINIINISKVSIYILLLGGIIWILKQFK